MQFTRAASEGKLLPKGIPPQIKEYYLQLIRDYLINEQIPRYSFWEFYICDTNHLVELFRQQLSKFDHCPPKASIEN